MGKGRAGAKERFRGLEELGGLGRGGLNEAGAVVEWAVDGVADGLGGDVVPFVGGAEGGEIIQGSGWG